MTSILTSWRTALATGLLAAAAVALVLALADGSGSSVATASSGSVSALYPALESKADPGITLVADPRQSRSTAATGPSFPANPPPEAVEAERWPVSSTIRRVSVDVPGVTAWIAESYGGGVCVLAWPGGASSAVGYSCSTAETLTRGAAMELRDLTSMPGKVLKVGVAPSGTKAMTMKLTSGSSASVPVSGNAWAYIADEGSTVPGSTTAVRG
jgi:hypothetical protein